MTTMEELPVPAEYLKESKELDVIWNDFINRGEDARSKIVRMVEILESNGYTRTQAVEKVESDHKYLKGFSRSTIYRALPGDMKRKYESSNDIIMLPDNSDVSNDTFEDLETSITENNNNNNKPKIQLSESALKEANKIKQQLQDKIDLVAKRHNKLKEDPKIEKKLIKEIASSSISVKDAKIKIDQEISDLNTGATMKYDNTYIADYTKREKIEKKPERAKQPIDYFIKFQDTTFPEMMHILTGHKLTEDETCYDPTHISNTETHRKDIINALTENEKNILYHNAAILSDALDSLMDRIDGGSTTKL
jgi:hypothetical protein